MKTLEPRKMSCRSKKCQSVLYFSMSIMFCLSSSHEMFLNSHAHCGRTGRGETDDGSVPYSVRENTTFTVKDDVSPSTKTEAFRECQMVFQSLRRDGRLCLMQRHWKIESCEMRLELFDGLAGTDGVKSPNVTMDCDHSLKSVEWCTTGRYLTLGVAKGGLQPSMKKVEVDFGVYDIRNKNRQVFMDSMPNCGSKFQLDSSQVTVSNLNPNLNTKPMFLCSLTFDYVGLEENKTVCLVFKSGISRSQCSLPYNLTVYSQQPNNKGYLEMLKYSCDVTLPERWCANGTGLRLDLLRSPSQNGTEKPNVFSILVLDHIGGPETLPSKGESENQSDSESFQAIWIVVPVCALALLFFIGFIVVVICHKSQKHKGDHQRVSSQDDEVSKSSVITNGKPGNGHMV